MFIPEPNGHSGKVEKADFRREEGDTITFKNGDNGADFHTVSPGHICSVALGCAHEK